MGGRFGTHRRHVRDELTSRQREVLELVARGRTNFEIAESLGISLEGVKYHVSEILARLGVDSREQAADLWRQSGGVLPFRPSRSFAVLAAALGGAAATVAALAVGMAIVGSSGEADRESDRTNAARARPCAVEGVDLTTAAIGNSLLFTVTYSTPHFPCRFAGGLSVVPYDVVDFSAEIAGLDRGGSSASFDEFVVQTSSVSSQFVWLNWCFEPRPILFLVLSGLKYSAPSTGAMLITDETPRCTNPDEKSRFTRFVAAPAASPPGANSAVQVARARPCHLEEIEISVQGEDPWELGRAALVEPVIRVKSPCYVAGDFALWLVDASGAPLGVRGNGARVAVSFEASQTAIRVPFRWGGDWCGQTGAVVARVEAVGGSWTQPLNVRPNCLTASPSAGASTLSVGWP